MEEQAILGKLKYLINKKRTIENIMKELGLKEYEVFGFVEILRQDGYHIKFDDGKFYFDKKIEVKVPNLYEMPKGISRKILLISDTHLGSKYDRLDILRYLYERAEEEEIDTVLHCGDLGDGLYPNRPNHQYELRVHGVDEHLDYIVNKYPHKDGIRTLFIGGNHDYDYIRTAGFDMGKAVSKARPDMIYLGQDVADVKYGRTRVRMFHGNKGPSYARSYKLQKYVEQIPSDEKPHIMLMGHFHNSFYMKYSDIHCIQIPALIDQTPYARSLGLNNEKGAWLIKMETDRSGNVITMEPELLDFSGQKKLIRKRN